MSFKSFRASFGYSDILIILISIRLVDLSFIIPSSYSSWINDIAWSAGFYITPSNLKQERQYTNVVCDKTITQKIQIGKRLNATSLFQRRQTVMSK